VIAFLGYVAGLFLIFGAVCLGYTKLAEAGPEMPFPTAVASPSAAQTVSPKHAHPHTGSKRWLRKREDVAARR
jgi:hypothetical protein